MTYNPYPYGHALDADALDDDLDTSDLDSVDDSNAAVLLNGMKVIFDKAVPIAPVNLLPKARLSHRKPHPRE